MATRKMTDAGDTLDDFIREECERDPEFRAGYEAELARLRWAFQIRQLREAARLTQAQLASRAGTHQTAVARLESGRVVPSLDLVDKLARVTGRRVELRFVASAAAAPRRSRRAPRRRRTG